MSAFGCKTGRDSSASQGQSPTHSGHSSLFRAPSGWGLTPNFNLGVSAKNGGVSAIQVGA